MSRAKYISIVVIVLVFAVVGQAEFQVNTHRTHDQIQPAVAVNDGGDFAVVWRSHVRDGRGGGVFGRCFQANGTPYGDEFQVNTGEVDVGDWAPTVAVSSSGTVVVLWVGDQNGLSGIVARMFDLEGRPMSEPWTVSAVSKMTQSTPSIAMNASGAFVVVWTHWDGGLYIGRNYVAGCVYDANGLPVSEAFQIADDPQALWPDVAMDDTGRFIVTWLRMGDTYNRPYGEYVMIRQYQADGTPCDKAISLTEDLNSRWYAPSVAASFEGQFVVTWAVGPFPYDIVAQSFNSTCELIGPLCRVNTIVEGNQGHPRVATNGAGDYLIVWDCHDRNGGCDISGQLFTQTCTMPGDELLFSTPTGRLNWYPDIAMSPDGHYVVVWIGQAEDSESGYDIFAQTGSF